MGLTIAAKVSFARKWAVNEARRSALEHVRRIVLCWQVEYSASSSLELRPMGRPESFNERLFYPQNQLQKLDMTVDIFHLKELYTKPGPDHATSLRLAANLHNRFHKRWRIVSSFSLSLPGEEITSA